MKLSEKQGGVLLMLLSALFFSAMQVAVSYSGSRIPVMEQVFCRNLISLVVAFVLIRKNNLSLFGDKSVQPLLFGRSFFGFVGVISLFYRIARPFVWLLAQSTNGILRLLGQKPGEDEEAMPPSQDISREQS